MILLNLIPQQFKMELTLRNAFHVIRLFLIVTSILTITGSILLVIARATLKVKLDDLQYRTKAMISQQNDFNAQVQSINKTVSDTSEVMNQFTPWSLLMYGLESVQPSQITLAQISLARQKDTTTLRIAGMAKTRSDLLIYQQQLQTLSFVADLQSPIENLLSTDNISFQLLLKLSPESISDKESL